MANTVIPSSMQKEEGNTDKSDEHTSGGSLQDFSDADALDKAEDSSPEQLSPDDETEYISGFKLGAVTAAVSLCSFLMLLDMSIVSTAIPVITNDFHSLKDIGWYVSSYQLTLSAFQPLSGRLFHYFSSKWTFFTFLGVFELGSLLCGVSVSSKMLIIARAIAGIGGSGIWNGALTIISASVPLEKRAKMTGICMGFCQLGLIIGPLVGGTLAQYSTWRWCFYINLPIGGFAAALMIFIHVPDQVKKPLFKSVVMDKDAWRKFDLVGAAIFVPTIVMLLLALHFGGNEYPWKSAAVIGLFCGFGGLAAVFLYWEYLAGDYAMMPFSIIRKRVIWMSCVSNMFAFGANYCVIYFLPIYFQAILNATPFHSGVDMLPSILPQIVFAVLSGFMVSKLGYYLPWMIASGALMAVAAGLLSTLSTSTSTGQWIGYQILFGAGRGAGIQIVRKPPILDTDLSEPATGANILALQAVIAVQTVVAISQLSVTMALTVFTQNLGASITISIANTIFDTSLRHQLVQRAPGVDADAIVAAGATEFRSFVGSDDMHNVLAAYATSVDRVFYFAVGLCVASFACAWGMGMNDVRKKKQTKEGDV